MVKTTMCITVDSTIREMINLRRKQDSSFNISNIINDFLFDLLSEDIKELQEEQLEKEKIELEKKLASIKAKQESIFERLKQEETIREKKDKQYWENKFKNEKII